MRLRPLLTAIAVAVGSAAVVALGGDTAVAAASSAGTYVAFDHPARVVDARLGAGHQLDPRIAGHGGLPAHGIGAVVGTLTAYAPTAAGRLVAYPGHRPGTASLYFDKGTTVSTTVVVGLHAGRVTIADVANSGHLRVALDVTGYYRSGSSSTPGAFHPVAPARVVSGRKLRHGHGFTATVAGRGGVPANSVGAVAVTIHVVSPTASGTLLAGSQDAPQPTRPAVHFQAHRAASAFVVVPLGSGAGIRLVNAAHDGTVQVLIDVVGYYSYGTAAQAGEYQPLPSAALGWQGTVSAATKSIQVGGHGGIPRAHVAAAVVVLHASGPHGSLQTRRPGSTRPPAPVSVTYAAGHTTSNTVLVPLSHTGRFELRSTSHHKAQVAVDVVGYVPASTITAPQPFVGRYVRNLTGTDDAADMATMHDEGVQDAAAGSRLVLLDIGAELNNRSGVLLSATKVELTWAQLVAALDAYLDGYAGAATAHGTVAVATNNDGNWHAYPAAARGHDWAHTVIDALAEHPQVAVAGAADIEAGFVSTRAQAQSWEDAYLAAATPKLLYFVGSADGCPSTFGATGGTCRFGWTEKQYYALAHHGTQVRVLPQIYTPDNAVQWADIDATGGGGLIFAGALTERAAAPRHSQQPAQGWAALYRALSTRSTSPHVPAVVDLRSDD